jgi:hypothetical protein
MPDVFRFPIEEDSPFYTLQQAHERWTSSTNVAIHYSLCKFFVFGHINQKIWLQSGGQAA